MRMICTGSVNKGYPRAFFGIFWRRAGRRKAEVYLPACGTAGEYVRILMSADGISAGENE